MSAPQSIESAVDDLRFDAIIETADLAASVARSAAEAAWRGDKLTVGIHLRQLRLCTIAAIQSFKELSADAGERAAPK